MLFESAEHIMTQHFPCGKRIWVNLGLKNAFVSRICWFFFFLQKITPWGLTDYWIVEFPNNWVQKNSYDSQIWQGHILAVLRIFFIILINISNFNSKKPC